MIKQNIKPLPVSVVDVLPKRCDSEGVLNPLNDLPAVSPGRMHAFHFVSAYRQEIPLIADHTAGMSS